MSDSKKTVTIHSTVSLLWIVTVFLKQTLAPFQYIQVEAFALYATLFYFAK